MQLLRIAGRANLNRQTDVWFYYQHQFNDHCRFEKVISDDDILNPTLAGLQLDRVNALGTYAEAPWSRGTWMTGLSCVASHLSRAAAGASERPITHRGHTRKFLNRTGEPRRDIHLLERSINSHFN